MTQSTPSGAGLLLSTETLPLPQPGANPVPARLGQTVTGTAAHTVIDLAFNTSMKAGSGTVFITDGSVQTVLDLATGQPTLRIVGATSTHEIPAASLRFDGQHVLIDAYDLTPGLNYSVIMAAGTLLSGAGKSFAGVRTPGQLGFVAASPVASGPTLDAIEVDGTVAHAGTDLWVNFTFSERVRQPDPTAFSTPNASLTDWRSDDGLTWSARLVGSAGVAVAANQLTVDMSKIRSLDDHPGRGTPPAASYDVDTVITSVVRALSLDEDTGPWHDDLITSGATQLFQGVINGSLSPGQQFELVIDGVAVPASAIRLRPFGEGSHAGYSWTAELTLGDGSHTVLARIADLGGHRSATLERTVVIDNSAPQMTSSASGATAFALDAAVVIQLNEALHWEPSEGLDDEITVEDRDGNISYLPFSLAQWSSDQRTLTLPASLLHLTAGNDYTIRLPESLTDLAGNGFGNQAIRLHTAGDYVDLMPPRALSAKVVNQAGSYGVGAQIDIRIQFNEPIALVPGKTPALRLNNGASAQFVAIDADHAMVFRYVVAAGEDVDELDIADDSALLGSVADLAGHPLDRAHVAYHVLSNDSAANHGSDISIVTTRPATPAMPALAAGSDSGAAGDSITSATLPMLGGGGVLPGALVILYDGATEIARGHADGAGAWSLRPDAALRDGEHQLTLRQADALGNLSLASTVLALQIDTSASAPAAPTLDADSDSGNPGDHLTKVATPHISGSGAEAYASIDLMVDGQRVDTLQADANGHWTATLATLADGEHQIGAVQVDRAGNRSDASPALTLRIDTAASGAPGAPQLERDSDSGQTGDLLTNVATPRVHGSGAEAHATVELWDGMVFVGSTEADGSGNWSLASATLTDGLHQLSARQVDAAGNRSAASDALTLTIDTGVAGAPGAPQLASASDSGARGDHITAVNTPTISGGDAENGATVELYAGATLLGSATAGPSGTWSIALVPLADGAYVLSARQVDAAGNRSAASATFALTIDTRAASAPTSLALAAASDSGTVGDGITRDNTPDISGQGAEAYALVELHAGERLIATTVADAQGNWVATLPAQEDGVLTLTARQVDAAGNRSVPSAPLALTIDTQAAAALAAPLLDAASDSGASGDHVTSLRTPTFYGSGALAGAHIALYADQQLVGHATADAQGGWRVTSDTLADGQYNFTVSQLDAAGNASAASPALTLGIDATAAGAPGTPDLDEDSDSGAIGDHITRDRAPVIWGTGAEGGATVELYLGDTLLGSGVANRDGAWSVDLPELEDGTYALRARQVDAAGNRSAASGTLTLIIDGRAGAALTGLALSADSDTGAQHDNITAHAAPTITGGGAESGATVQLFLREWVVATAIADAHGNWRATLPEQTDGPLSITARQIDAAGNRSPVSATLNLTIDTHADAPGTPALGSGSDSGTADDGRTNLRQPVIVGSADAGAGVDVYLDQALAGHTVADEQGNWSFTLPSQQDGQYVVTARQTDAAGNLSDHSAALALVIDTVAAALPRAPQLAQGSDSGALGDGITNVAMPELTGDSAEAGATIALYVDEQLVKTTIADGGGEWRIQLDHPLTEGSHAVAVRQADAAGNTSDFSPTLYLRVDTTAPSAPLGMALDSGSDSGSLGDLITNHNRPTFSGNGAMAFNGRVELYDGEQRIGWVATNETGSWSITPTDALADGPHTLTVRQVDAAGNPSAPAPAVLLTIDTESPATLATPRFTNDTDSGSDHHDGITNITAPSFSGRGANWHATVEVYANGQLLGTTVADEEGFWTWNSLALPEGDYAITVSQRDTAGNRSLASDTLPVVIDTHCAPPTFSLAAADDTGASHSDGVTSATTLHFTGNAEPFAQVVLYDLDAQVGEATADEHGVWNVTLSDIVNTTLNLSAVQTDAAGNPSAPSSAVIVRADQRAPAWPYAPDHSVSYDFSESVLFHFGDRLDMSTLEQIQLCDVGNNVLSTYDSHSDGWGLDSEGNTTLDMGQMSGGLYKIHFVGHQMTDLAGNRMLDDLWGDIYLWIRPEEGGE